MRKGVSVPAFGETRTNGSTAKDTHVAMPLMVAMAGAPGVGDGLNDSSRYSTIIQGKAGFKVRKAGGNTTVVISGYH